MAFNKANFSGSLGGGSGAAKLYVFRDLASTKAQVAAADYFLSIQPILDVGDVIMANCSNGTMFLPVVASTSVTVTTEMLEITTA